MKYIVAQDSLLTNYDAEVARVQTIQQDLIQAQKKIVELQQELLDKKTVEVENMKSRSVIIFGLAEEENEKLSDRVTEIFEEIGSKPQLEACRLGKPPQSGTIRPVKVTVSNATVANSVLLRARDLKDSTLYSSVFIRRDRSPEDRARHRELVVELRKKKGTDPSQRHYIKGGRVISAPI